MPSADGPRTPMLLHARSPLLRDQMVEVELVNDDDPPGPFVRFAGGLCLTLSSALDTYEVIDASHQERAILALARVVIPPGQTAS
jgi:hypothetical protein